MRSTYTCFFLVCVTMSYAQDWQTYYKESTSAFTSQKFEEALALSEKALPLSMDDAKTQAFTLQIITASSLELSKPDLGLQHINKEIELFSNIEANGKNYADALLKKAKLHFMSGKPTDAAVSYGAALPALERAYGEKNYDYYLALFNQGQAFLMIEKFNEANHNFELCENAFAPMKDAGEDYLYSLYYRGMASLKLSQKEISQQKLTTFINLVEKNQLKDWPEYGEAQKMLKSISINAGDSKTSQQLTTLLNRAIEIQNTSPSEARSLYEASEKLIIEQKVSDAQALTCYINFTNVLSRLHELEKAGQKLIVAKALGGKLFSPTAPELGYIKKSEAFLLLQSGNPDQAVPLYKSAISLFTAASPEVRYIQMREIARELSSVDLNEALAALEQGLDNPDFTSIPASSQIQFIKLFASLCLNGQRPAQMLSALDRNASKYLTVDTKQAYHLYKGMALGSQGNFEKSQESLKAAVADNPQSDLVSEAYYEIARHHQNAGNVKEAEEYYDKSIRMLKNKDENLVNQVYNSFATFYLSLGNYTAAERLLTNLLKGDNQHSLFYNTIRQNLAVIYQQTGRYVEAKRLFREILKTEEGEFGKIRPEYTITLQNLALVYQKLNKTDSALLIMTEALNIDKSIYGESNLTYAAKMANLGALYQDAYNFPKAKELYESALIIRKKFLSPQHPDYAFNVFNLAYLHYRTNNAEQALPLFRETSAYYIKQIKEVFPALSDYERTVFYNKVKPVIQAIESFMTEHAHLSKTLPGELLNFRLETKALLLNSSMKTRNAILASGNNALIAEFQSWIYTKEQLAILYSLSASEQQQRLKLIDEYEAKANALEKKLSLESEAFATSFQRSNADWTMIQKKLKPTEAAVEIIRVSLPKKDSTVYAALVVKQSGSPELVVLSRNKSESKDFNLYRNSIAFKAPDTISYHVYWKKIDQVLRGIATVYLSPDGVYNKINCITLYDASTKQFLLDRLNVQLLTNLKELLNSTGTVLPIGNAFLIGNPDFKQGTTAKIGDLKNSTADGETFFEVLQGGLSELPGTAEEVSQVGTILGQKKWSVTISTREKATEDLIKTLKPDVLHIATHGFFISGDEKKQQVNDASLSNIKANSMLRSGLLLSGSEKYLADKLQGKVMETKREDGVLTALEVMNLALDKTSLVVLSACETAGGDLRNGEGVYGLQRAFLLAGAKNLIMSLWKVDDTATQQLMTNFYTFWMNGDTKSVAFRKAQQELKTKYPTPYFWGAFVLVGNN